MDTLIITALAKILTTKATAQRGTLEPGEYTLHENVTLGIEGTLKVFEDHSYQPTTSIPLKVAMALFLRYSGATGQNAMNALVRAMTEALEIEALPEGEKKTALKAIRELADLKEAEKTVKEGLALLPPRPRRGKVVVDASVETSRPEDLDLAFPEPL